MFNKSVKRGSISLVIREMHIKAPMIYLTAPRMVIIKTTINPGEDLKF